MFAADTNFQAQVMAMVKTVKGDFHTHEDMFQEAMYHLATKEPENPGNNESYWIESCKLHLRNTFKLGKSVDAPKRRHLTKSLDARLDSEESLPEALIAENPVFLSVSARDLAWEISLHLKPRQAEVLMALAEGYGVEETAARFNLDRRTVSNYRKVFVAAAVRIGLAE